MDDRGWIHFHSSGIRRERDGSVRKGGRVLGLQNIESGRVEEGQPVIKTCQSNGTFEITFLLRGHPPTQ